MGNATTAKVCGEDIKFEGANAKENPKFKNRDLTSCLYLNLNSASLEDMDTKDMTKLLYLNFNNTKIKVLNTKPLKSLCVLCANNSALSTLEL